MGKTKYLGVLSLLVITSFSGCSTLETKEGFEILALGCEIRVAPGYFVVAQENRVLVGAYSVQGARNPHPSFHYYPDKSWYDLSSTMSAKINVSKEEVIGDWKYLRVEYLMSKDQGDSYTWDIVTSDSEFFGSMAKYGTEFVDQFRECAKG